MPVNIQKEPKPSDCLTALTDNSLATDTPIVSKERMETMDKPTNTEITIIVRDGMVTDTIANTPDIVVSILDMDCCDFDEYEKQEEILSALQKDIDQGKAWYVKKKKKKKG